MAKYQKYAVYKDSGVVWLGEIPSHWDLKPSKFLFNIVNGSTPKSGVEEYWEGDITWVTPSDLSKIKNFEVSESARNITNKGLDSCGTSLVPSGSLILSCRAPIGSLAITTKEVCTNQGCKSLVVKDVLNTKFIFYFLSVSTEQLNILGRGTTFLELSSDELGNYKVPFPTINEQFGIAKFLDHETAQIDTLIAKQEKLIELLKEKRQAVISHTVTKGLNPNVAMKDSGVEWLGEVPEHWVVKSYRHASRIYRGKFGHRPRNDPAFYDGDYPFIQTGDVARAGKYITSYSQTLNEKGKDVSQLFPKGTLMMAIAANIGDLAILGFEAYAPDSVVGFKPNQQIDLEFLRYSFMAALPALEQTSTQSTQANLNVERIGAVHGVFPSFEEQREIVNHLDELLDKYNIIEKEMNKAINLLQERRTALISAAVTGKIDVRNWQHPNQKNEADVELSA